MSSRKRLQACMLNSNTLSYLIWKLQVLKEEKINTQLKQERMDIEVKDFEQERKDDWMERGVFIGVFKDSSQVRKESKNITGCVQKNCIGEKNRSIFFKIFHLNIMFKIERGESRRLGRDRAEWQGMIQQRHWCSMHGLMLKARADLEGERRTCHMCPPQILFSASVILFCILPSLKVPFLSSNNPLAPNALGSGYKLHVICPYHLTPLQ